MDPASLCTSNDFYGCTRSTSGTTIINPIASARLRTAENFSFKYGRVEVRAKLPLGDWLWPAIWFLPEQQAFGPWPVSGEIDLMESRGNSASYQYGGVNTFGSTLHLGPNYHYDAWNIAHQTYTLPSGDFSQDFHVFGLYWNETNIYTYIDEDTPANRLLNLDLTTKSFWDIASASQGWDSMNFANPYANQSNIAPFNQPFYIVLNVAVGGTGGYFPDGPEKPWSNQSPIAAYQFWQAQSQWGQSWVGENTAMVVDYVRVWAFNTSDFRIGSRRVNQMKVVDELDLFFQSLN